MEDVNLKTIVLEDNIEYFIIKEEENYLYLANVNNPNDVCIRKLTKENDEEFIIPLKDDNEVEYALSLFTKKD